MAKILINALNLSIGGGKNILDNYIRELSNADLTDTYYVLTPNFKMYSSYSKDKLNVIDIESIFKANVFFIGLYFFKFPILLKKYKIDLVFNFGDIVIPTSIPQIYFFDWPYAVYSEEYVWRKMSLKDYVIRKTKIFLINKYADKAVLTIAQTKNIATRLIKKFKNQNVTIIPTPVGIDLSCNKEFYGLDLDKNKKYFFYPASYSTHKNFDVVLDLLKLIKKEKMPFVLILTLDFDVASEFLEKIKSANLNNVINLGKVDLKLMPSLYKQVDALFFPSLLETYGLPYIEAMAFEKPILASNLDFAHAICDDMAFYFDPFDAESILNVMMHYDDDKEDLETRISKGKLKVNTIPNWEEVFTRFNKEIEIVLNKK
ncbi:glycosyltransferase [Flavobacterium sp. B11]|uniref:glycosyltransferase n=1 Tax=Flavobacterium movens TaxID=214860 RepID=UPI0031E2B42A